MGWDYVSQTAFGIHVKSWKVPKLKELLKKYQDIISYSREMSLYGHGTLFVYLKYTYKEYHLDHGSYCGGRLDTTGTEFDPPQHPLIHKKNESKEKISLTSEETVAFGDIFKNCVCIDSLTWIDRNFISY